MPIAPPNGTMAAVPLSVTDMNPQPSTRPTEVPRSSGQNTQSATAQKHGETTASEHDDGASELSAAVDTLNRSMQAWSTHLRFEIDTDNQEMMVQVVDSISGKVIKTIPAQSVIEAAAEVARQFVESNNRLESQA
mgnify:CR=1 FL=1